MINLIKNKSGTALLMTLLIFSSVMIVVLNASEVMFTGILMSGVQERSTVALYAAEAGGERSLYEARKKNNIPTADGTNIYGNTVLSNQSIYNVDYASSSPNIKFISKGTFFDTVRTVYLEFENASSTYIGGTYLLGEACALDSDCLSNICFGGVCSGCSISTCSQLQNVKDDLSSNHALCNDIDCSETIGWNSGRGFVPLGLNSAFTGKFDGQNFTISNLYFNNTTASSRGLFYRIAGSAEVKNLHLINVNLVGYRDYSAGLIGIMDGGLVDSVDASGSVTGHAYTGGLVGYLNAGTIQNSNSSVVVTSNYTNVGGLVGYVGSSGMITDSYATGAVIGEGYTGGLAGNSYGVISRSFASGDVSYLFSTSTSQYYGGLIGRSRSGSVTNNSYARGSVQTIGQAYVGGLLGGKENGILTNTYSIGSVSGTIPGGLAGVAGGGSTASSYWDITSSGQPLSGTGTGITPSSDMKISATFTGWDINGSSGIWKLDALTNDGYPCLKDITPGCN